MKLTTLLLITAILQVSASTFAQRVTLSEKNTPLNKVFEKISDQTGYDFLISTENLKKAKAVTVNIQNEDLKKALDEIFADQLLTFEIQEKMVVVSKMIPLLKSREPISPILIRGKVTDTTGSPLPGATIKIKGRDNTTFTNVDGTFSITAEIGDTLVVSFVGFETLSLKIKSLAKQLNIELHADMAKLNEVTVVSTGYQLIPKERSTGSFSQVDNKLFNQRVSANFIERLEGNVPGLLFNKNTSNSTNGRPDINIRGHSTLFANDQPLVVLDNFPYEGELSNINPNDIENISILKDAAAASIWGVRSGNGVIVITTKKGKKNQDLKVEFNTNFSIGGKPDLFYKPNESVTSADRIDLEQRLFSSGYYNNDLSSSSFPAVPPVVTILNRIKNNSLDSFTGQQLIDKLKTIDNRSDLSKYFYQTSISQQYSVNFQGGGSNSNYYFSLGYDKNRSNQVGNENERININAQYNFYPVKNLSISAGLTYTITQAQNNTVLSDLNTLKSSGKLSSYSDLVDDQSGKALSVPRLNPDYLANSATSKFLNWEYRPFDELKSADNQNAQVHNKFNLSTSYKIVTGLSISAMYQYERALTNTNNYFSPETYYTRNLINQFTNLTATNPYPVPIGGILNSSRAELNSNRGRIQTDFHKTWKDAYEITAIAGAEISETVRSTNANTAFGYNKDTQTSTNVDLVTRFPTNPTGTLGIPNSNSFGKFTDRYLSYFGNSAFTYKGKYTYSISGRIDKSNLFGVNTNQKAVPLYLWDLPGT
jgi:TonB-linked SusC/RagA family outer membrane protein